MSSMSRSQAVQSVKGRLVGQFEGRPVAEHGRGWSALWDAHESGLWDRGTPSPALVDLLEQRKELLAPLRGDGRRKKALVPGCGRGYDVVTLALHGFDAYGLDVSAAGVAAAEEYAAAELLSPSRLHFAAGAAAAGRAGRAVFVQGDFFDAGWEAKIAPTEPSETALQFDLVYDYTFFCAIHPAMRRQWARRMGELLHADALLVCLEFPMYKDPQLPGPPWGVNGVYWDLLVGGSSGGSSGGNSGGNSGSNSGSSSSKFRRILYLKPARTYPVGSGTDMLSVYARL